MTNQFSTERLQRNLKMCSRTKKTPAFQTEGALYLYKHFYLPLFCEKTVMFGDLDYTRFNISDIEIIGDLCREKSESLYKLNGVYAKLVKTKPVSQPTAFV